MNTVEKWQELHAACDLLLDLASSQARRDVHPLAGLAAQWLEQVGAVAAREGGACAPSATLLPTAGMLQ